MRNIFALLFLLLILPKPGHGQGLTEVPPISVEGRPVEKMELYVTEGDSVRIVTGEEYNDFISYFHLQNKDLFNQSVYDLKAKKMLGLDEVQSVEYKTFISQISGPITIRWYITAYTGDSKQIDKGFFKTGKLRDLPLLVEAENSKLEFFMNGGLGGFIDNNAFFAKGPEFTQGNPVADDPPSGGASAWSEMFLEPGIGGITEIGNSDLYLYGAVSGLFSARMGSDIYTNGSTGYVAIERAYAGFIWAHIGKEDNVKLNVSAGRNFFQLNDGFLFSRYSGSANAGERGSVYLSSRTTFQKTVIATLSSPKFTLTGFFLEPQELFNDRQTNINYTGVTMGYNNNRTVDTNISLIKRTNGLGSYSLPDNNSIPKKGITIINPKLWLTDIAQTGVYIKTEYAYEYKTGMSANAWYAGIGIRKDAWRMNPSLYYRYGFMQGDDPATDTYERFDPILTGGLGNWVQGLNFRKVLGNGNITSHRIELTSNPNDKLLLTLDAFFLAADELNNLGGLPPISELQSDKFGQEYTFSFQYNLSSKFLILGVFSVAFPGDAISENLPGSQGWQTYQLNVFMFL